MIAKQENPIRQAELTVDIRAQELRIANGIGVMTVSLDCPTFIMKDIAPHEWLVVSQSLSDALREDTYQTSYRLKSSHTGAGMDVELHVEWSPGEGVLRKWARLKLDPDAEEMVLQEVILESFDVEKNGLARLNPHYAPGGMQDRMQSQPVFFGGSFAGIEFPVSSTRMENGRFLLAHRPGSRLVPGEWQETKKAVYGFSGQEGDVAAFQIYLRRHCKSSGELHVNYNSWYTSPVPYSREDILEIMREFRERMYDKHGESLDTFCIDLGWSDKHSIWEIDRDRFPNGFSELQEEAGRMDSHLGLWISPTACYMDALDNDWAASQGYGTSVKPWTGGHTLRFVCLGDDGYRQAFQSRIVEMVRDYPIRQIKFDGCVLDCTEESHGHETGTFSTEKIAQGIIDVFRGIRGAVPEVWMETTCFGWNPSPWWLWYVDSVLGNHGDDVPFGRVPAPVYRESYTSSRDFFNLQGTAKSFVPPACQEVLGIVHQTPDCFLNDAVMTLMRGHYFLPVYLNPKFMSEERWEKFAGFLKWARAQAPRLRNTMPLLPASWSGGRVPVFTNDARMPREPYGYAHWDGVEGLVALRNPWIEPVVYSLRLPAGDQEGQRLQVVGIYPEMREYGKDIPCGEVLDIRLAPYETIVLSVTKEDGKFLASDTRNSGVPYIDARIEKRIQAEHSLELESSVTIFAPQAVLLVLAEGKPGIAIDGGTVRVNGALVKPQVCGSVDGFDHSWLPKVEEDWTFLRIPLENGENRLQLELSFDPQTVASWSVWVWATKKGETRVPASGLAQPDTVSLDAVKLSDD